MCAQEHTLHAKGRHPSCAPHTHWRWRRCGCLCSPPRMILQRLRHVAEAHAHRYGGLGQGGPRAILSRVCMGKGGEGGGRRAQGCSHFAAIPAQHGLRHVHTGTQTLAAYTRGRTQAIMAIGVHKSYGVCSARRVSSHLRGSGQPSPPTPS